MAMRTPIVLVLVLALSGCSAATDGDSGAGEPTGGDDPRTGRAGDGCTDCEEEVPHEDVMFLSEALTAVGPGPVTFDAVVPANLTRVYFIIDVGAGPAPVLSGVGGVAGLRVELAGCGVFDSGGGGYFGSVYYKQVLCSSAPAAGTQVASVSAQAMAFQDARFELWGWRNLPS